MSRSARAAVAVLTAALVVPSSASAHGLTGRGDLPIPGWLFTWGATAVLVLSFVALSTLWPRPRFEGQVRERQLLRLPTAVRVPTGAFGVALLALTIVSGFLGTQNAQSNFAPTFVSAIFWVGVPFSVLFLGDWFRAVNPWRAIGRVAGALVARRGGAPEALPYPTRLGQWPAAATIILFAWFELAYGGFDDPSAVALLTAVYTAVQLIGMSLYGVEAWCQNAEGFGVYFGLVGRIGPLGWKGPVLVSRPWLSATTALVPVAGTVATVMALIGTTTFDGFANGPVWTSLAPHLQRWFGDLGLGLTNALRLASTLGLAVVVGLVAAAWTLGVRGMRSASARAPEALGPRFAHSLVPIALAYVVAHYFSYLVLQGQALGYLVSDPLGNGSDLFGTADASIDYGLLSANRIWYFQVAALLAGHLAGLVLAHDRALVTWPNVRDAVRSQYWMLMIMIGFTSLGLWLLSVQA